MNPLTQIKNTQKISAQEVAAGLSDNASWHAKYKDSAYVFAGGLGYDLTEGDLLAVFAQYGELMDVNLVRDQTTGKSKGFAFLAYEDQRSTVLAVDNLNGAKIAGRIVRVDHVANYKRKKEEDEEERNAAREERGVCYAFQRGECTRGNACRFSHDEQRNSKGGWGPKEELESKTKWPNDRFPSNGAKESQGQKAGYGFRKDDAGPVKAVMGPPRAPLGGASKEEAASTSSRGGGAALPWEGGLFSMLADRVDNKRPRKEEKQPDEKGERQKEKHGAEGAGKRERERGRSPKRHRSDRDTHELAEERGFDRQREGAGERNGDEASQERRSRASRKLSGERVSQTLDGKDERRGRDDRLDRRADIERGSKRDDKVRNTERGGPHVDRNVDAGREQRESGSRGDEGSWRDRKEPSESNRRIRHER